MACYASGRQQWALFAGVCWAGGSRPGRVYEAVELLLVQVIAVIRRSALVEWTSFAS